MQSLGDCALCVCVGVCGCLCLCVSVCVNLTKEPQGNNPNTHPNNTFKHSPPTGEKALGIFKDTTKMLHGIVAHFQEVVRDIRVVH